MQETFEDNFGLGRREYSVLVRNGMGYFHFDNRGMVPGAYKHAARTFNMGSRQTQSVPNDKGSDFFLAPKICPPCVQIWQQRDTLPR